MRPRAPGTGSNAAPSDPPFIDVRELIQRLSQEDLLQAADKYFSELTLESEQCYKPFSNIDDAVQTHRRLALLLEAAKLQRGHDVLDFGCGTGWLTWSFASLGCQAIGVDIAPSAISLAQRWVERRGLRAGTGVLFRAYDGCSLPVEAASIDRIICFDSFHHVTNQAATLREFARVLRPGGRIAMLEPGPNHSRTAQSQREMARYKVIENDVKMREVHVIAREAGLDAPTMLVQPPAPLEVPVEEYLAWDDGAQIPDSRAKALIAQLQNNLTDTQCFFITKPGRDWPDSRTAAALAGELKLLSAQGLSARRWRFRVKVRNTGEGIWRTASRGVGQVNLGVQLLDQAGQLLKLDFARVPLGEPDVPPGAERTLEFELAVPEHGACSLGFDLVSESVCWFGDQRRCRPVVWTA
jgi:ubiquinone/menaquinone biosynthesis C-methylase UbiE